MSGSMASIREKTIKVFDDVVKHAAERSLELEQETRATIYVFSSGYKAVQCVAYDVNVLRLPSLGIYTSLVAEQHLLTLLYRP